MRILLLYFFYLPSKTDRKEGINQWKGNPSLKPVDSEISFIESFSSKMKIFNRIY